MKFRKKLLVSFFLASSLPLIIISVMIYAVSANIIEDSSKQFGYLYLAEISASLNRFERDYDLMSRLILNNEELMRILQEPEIPAMNIQIRNEREIRTFFMGLAANYPEIQNFMLLSVTDLFYSLTRTAGFTNINNDALTAQPWFKKIREDQALSFFISPAHRRDQYGANQESVLITLGRKIYSYTGVEIGIIMFDLDPARMINLGSKFEEIDLLNHIRLTIINPDNEVVYNSDAVNGRSDWSFVWPPGNYGTNGRDAPSDILVLQANSDSGLLSSIIEIPLNELLAPLKNVRMFVFIFIVLWIGAIIFFAVKYSASIVRPILDLQQSMIEVEKENYTAFVKLPGSEDEIADLVRNYNIMIAKIRELIENVYILDIKQKQARLQALWTQINPHMLYNTLESIRMEAVINNQDKTAEMIKVLARMFKHSLKHEKETNLIKDELRHAQDYVYIHNMRYSDLFILENRLSGRVMETPCISIILQPIIENSIIHGFRSRVTPLRITIDEDFLPGSKVKVSVSDNGLGLPQEEVDRINAELLSRDATRIDSTMDKKMSGIGLMNISERFHLQYGSEYSLQVSSCEGQWFKTEFIIPFNQEPAEADAGCGGRL